MPESANIEINVASQTGITQIAAPWDSFVPRDVPHLRSGFLRAVERAGMLQDMTYLVASREGATALRRSQRSTWTVLSPLSPSIR